MRKLLSNATIALTLVGCGALFWTAFTSMKPSEKTKAYRSSHDISQLKAGSYLIENFSNDYVNISRILIIKDWHNNLAVFAVPIKHDLVQMPDVSWGRTIYECKDFRPDTANTGQILPAGKIRCHDNQIPDFWQAQWIWDYAGKSNSPFANNIPKVKYEMLGNTLKVYR